MSSPSATDGDASGAVRRASGRVRKQPDIYASGTFSNGKRKRSDEDGTDDVQMPEDYVSDEEEPLEEEEPDEEEIREQARKARKPRATTARKPAQKRSKVNSTTLTIRTAPRGGRKRAPRKAKTTGINSADAEEAGGLYAEVFASETGLAAIVADWLKGFDAHESHALAQVINFILKCAGCGSTVSEHDVEDPDGCTNRLTDIQEEFQATAPTDYPLIAKGKAGSAFRETLAGFLNTLIKSTAVSGVLYNNVLIENIEAWFSTLSSAGNRAFRHTATFASLSVMTALAEVVAERAKEAAATQRQADMERKKANFNKPRVRQLEQKAKSEADTRELLDTHLKDWFDTVFIHRYRDVDPAIRRDCVTALGDWIIIYPELYFDGQHLRYLGWVLSDTVSATRGEVLKQLQRFYKEENKVGGLKTFTERFRTRLVEIAASDADTTVRASGIDLLGMLREHGLLEPDDIDAVGRLVYDSDPRVRKAVASFFAENVNDVYNSKIDDLGGLENLEESLPEIGEDNFETPRLEWLKFKSLAETLVAYETDESLPNNVERNRGDGALVLHAIAKESRLTLAADVLYDKIAEVKDWQALSGYLLFDHSAGRANGIANDAVSQLKHECILNTEEEVVLLEVVSASVRRTVVELAEKTGSTKSKLTKRQKDELTEEQEEVARHLAGLIPKLLKKFGDVPNTAAAVLRMESVLNIPSLEDLRQDSATYGALLDDIRKQFLAHGTDEVLGPASEAILHAKSYGELDDLTEGKLGSLWEDVINNLTELLNPDTITVRGASEREEQMALSNILLRITRLAQVSNPIASLEDSSVATSNEASGADYQGAIDYIIALVQRGLPADGPEIPPEEAASEDEISTRAAETALRYLQWKISYIVTTATSSTGNDIPFAELEALAMRRDQYVNNLQSVLEARRPGDPICFALTELLLDLYSSSVVMKTIKLKPGMRDDWDALIMDLQPAQLKLITKVFSAAEKSFAQLSNKKLEEVAAQELDGDIDAEPVDEDPLSDDESEQDDDEATQTQASQQRRESRQRNAVIAERRLCELTRSMIYAVHAGVVQDGSLRKRLERNRAKLGPNFKEILAYLDMGKAKRSAKAKPKPKNKPAVNGVAAKSKRNPKSNAIVAEDEMEDDIEDADGDDEEALRRGELLVEDDAHAGGVNGE